DQAGLVVLHDLGDRARVAADHEAAAGEGLEEDEAEGLRPERGNGERDRAAEELRAERAADEAEEAHARLEAELARETLEVGAGLALARDRHEQVLRARARDRAEQHVEALLWREATEPEDERPARELAEVGRRA